jgi:hypothetical protein
MKIEEPALRVLEMLKKEAPKMELGKAYAFMEEYQAMRYDLMKDEFIIMMLLKALGTDDSGWLRDKVIAEKLKDMPDEIWTALRLAGNIHAGYVCSPFTPKDWVKEVLEKLEVKKENVDSWKESQLSVALKSDNDMFK